MLFKKIMAASLACVMAISFASCGKSGSTTTTTAKDNTAKKTLVLATNAAFPPFEFVVGTDGSEFDGIDILIGKEIAKDMNCELKIENMDFESTLSAIASGKADLVLAGMTVKPDRLENADFSMPYWTAEQTIIVNDKNTDIKNVASLKGKNIGVVTGYTGDSTLTEQGLKSELKRYKKGVDAVMDLKNSKLDAVVIDSPTAERFITQFGGLKGMKDTAVFGKEEYAIAVKKGNTELLEKVNTTIKRLKENGDIARFATEVDGRLGK